MLSLIASAGRKTLPEDVMDVTIDTGQSNRAGRQGEAGGISPNANIRIANYGPWMGNTSTFGTFGFPVMQADVNSWSLWDYPITGGEQASMRAIQARLNRVVYCLKITFGGYDISHWGPGRDFYIAFGRAIADIEAYALSNGYTSVRYRLIYGQGESDAQLGTPDYATKLIAFINYLRSLSEYGFTNKMPVYLQLLSPLQYEAIDIEDIEAKNADFQTVRAALNNVYTFDPTLSNPGIQSDKIHYPFAGLQAVDEDLVKQMIKDRTL